MDQEFLPLLFAADINVYSVARAFHERYGIKSTVYGRAAGGPCADSAIIDYTSVADADAPDTLLRLVNEFAAAHADRKVLAIGCGDSYVRSICERKHEFAENVIAPYADFALIDELTNKETFYALCEREGIDYPDTFIHTGDMA
ncbi:MAG: ATP-grasp domain-containing protein, partial [Clostridiales Family XIII bacterium]|nr:ATP-grasp domain-containing protein [Clostridiales Family XIII bacterium]